MTALTGVSGEALSSTGGCCDTGLILVDVVQLGHGLGLLFTADGTGEGLLAFSFFRGLLGYGAAGPLVAQSGDLICSVAVAAGTGVGGETLFGTGGSGGSLDVLVVGGIHGPLLVIIAAGADALFNTLFGAGGSDGLGPLAQKVAQGVGFVGDVGIAASAGVGGEALFGTGGSS